MDLFELPEEFQEFGKGLLYYCQCVAESAEFAKNISQGTLNITLPAADNEIAAPLKKLHAALKHLTWQAQRVAKGDYKQRVDFMGEFSDAFNTMIEQLEQQRESLLAEIRIVRNKTQALEQNNSLFEAITGQISQWIIVSDFNTADWLYINHPVEEILSDYQSEHPLRLWMNNQAELLNGKVFPYLTELELPIEGGSQYFSVVIHPLGWRDKSALAFVFTDISAEKKQMCDLKNAAYTDKMTQTYNRNYAMQLLNEMVSEKKPFVLCFVDLDNLKEFNDIYGHTEGDEYIIAVANLLHEFSLDCVVCRFGGDEFVVLAENWSYEVATTKMEELRNKLIKQNPHENGLYETRISYGIIEVLADNALSVNELLTIADEKMYEYKREYKRMRKNKIGFS